MSYVDTIDDILALHGKEARAAANAAYRRDLIRRSDDLLERLETANLGRYGALKTWSNLEACRLTHDLVAAINELLADGGSPARRLRTTAAGLEAVWAAQARLFGQPDDDDLNDVAEEDHL